MLQGARARGVRGFRPRRGVGIRVPARGGNGDSGPGRGVGWGFGPERGVGWGFEPRARGVDSGPGAGWELFGGKMENFLPFCRFFAV